MCSVFMAPYHAGITFPAFNASLLQSRLITFADEKFSHHRLLFTIFSVSLIFFRNIFLYFRAHVNYRYCCYLSTFSKKALVITCISSDKRCSCNGDRLMCIRIN